MVNVYDFDNTIYDGESTFDFFLFYARTKPHILKYLPRVLLSFARYKLGKITSEQFLKINAPIIKKEFAMANDLPDLAKKFWDTHIDKIKPFYAKMQKESDIIVTASPEVTVKEICSRLNIKNYLCSVINEDGIIERMNMRENKVEAFKREYGDLEIGDFYTDSIKNDGFLAERAEHVFIVKGNKIKQIK